MTDIKFARMKKDINFPTSSKLDKVNPILNIYAYLKKKLLEKRLIRDLFLLL